MTIRSRVILSAVLVVASITGCVPHSTRPDVVLVAEPGKGQVAQILDSVSVVLNEPPAAQAVAIEKLAAQLKMTQFPDDRMRLALLYALLPEPARNGSRAAALLSGYNWEAAGPGFKSLAMLILGVLNTRQVNASNIQTLTRQLTSEQAQKNHLQQQLDALTGIEKTMNKRDKPIVTPPAAAISHALPAPPGMP